MLHFNPITVSDPITTPKPPTPILYFFGSDLPIFTREDAYEQATIDRL